MTTIGLDITKDWVTILILIDGFLQSKYVKRDLKILYSHNPYFNRWFSAIWTCKFKR